MSSSLCRWLANNGKFSDASFSESFKSVLDLGFENISTSNPSPGEKQT